MRYFSVHPGENQRLAKPCRAPGEAEEDPCARPRLSGEPLTSENPCTPDNARQTRENGDNYPTVSERPYDGGMENCHCNSAPASRTSRHGSSAHVSRSSGWRREQTPPGESNDSNRPFRTEAPGSPLRKPNREVRLFRVSSDWTRDYARRHATNSFIARRASAMAISDNAALQRN